ncbi:hypothetical protein BD769DRAFT_1391606 [Suillus cothurnatus]|nr:hypothetical protein BD769DRAFT_1391606 [Suillus cothurnatus]
MTKLWIATDKNAARVLVSDAERLLFVIIPWSSVHHRGCRNFHQLLVQTVTYGLLGENESGKSTFPQSSTERDIEIPTSTSSMVRQNRHYVTDSVMVYWVRMGLESPPSSNPLQSTTLKSHHIDIYLLHGETEPSDVNAIDFIMASAHEKAAKLEKHIEDLSIADDVDDTTLEAFWLQPGSHPTKDRSGGWRTRLHSLLSHPTNHLDLGAVIWLEAYLSTYNHVLVITSHSQGFTVLVCADVMDLMTKNKLIY